MKKIGNDKAQVPIVAILFSIFVREPTLARDCDIRI